MKKQKALEQLNKEREMFIDKYFNYQQLTNEIFDLMIEMLSVDYQNISSEGKRLRIIKNYMIIIFQKSV